MPLNGIDSYLPTMDEFSPHWQDVNTELGGTPATDLKLQGGFTRAMFLALRDGLAAALVAIVDLENARETAVTNRDQKKTAIMFRINQFRGMLRGLLPTSIYVEAAPRVPTFGFSEGKFLEPFDDMASLWGRIDADVTIPGFTPPLLLGAVARATFVAELAALRAAYLAVSTAENDAEIGRKQRDALLPQARERMVQYRELVPAILGPEHPLALSLPAITPAPGHTPTASVLTGNWNPTLLLAQFSWNPSDDPDLDEYELRMSPGASYNEATATVVGNIPPGTTTFETNAGLTNPGDVASFRLFVRLTTGNEAGSNVITITRP